MNIYSATFTLILVMDPIGNIPIFVALLKGIAPKRQAFILLREMLIAFAVLALFLFFGSAILEGLSITEPALEIAGGIILFIIALRMIFPNRAKQMMDEEDIEGEPFVVPMAIPLMAGPSALATVLLFSTQEPQLVNQWFIAIVIASSVSLIILLSAQMLMRFVGKRGLIALERLMGMILTTVSVQMFLDGAKLYFASV